MRRLYTLLLLTLFTGVLLAQNYNSIDPDGNIRPASNRQHADSTKGEKEIPIGLKVWTVDERFGDITPTEPDTMAYLVRKKGLTIGEVQVHMGKRIAGESYLTAGVSISYMARQVVSMLLFHHFR